MLINYIIDWNALLGETIIEKSESIYRFTTEKVRLEIGPIKEFLVSREIDDMLRCVGAKVENDKLKWGGVPVVVYDGMVLNKFIAVGESSTVCITLLNLFDKQINTIQQQYDWTASAGKTLKDRFEMFYLFLVDKVFPMAGEKIAIFASPDTSWIFEIAGITELPGSIHSNSRDEKCCLYKSNINENQWLVMGSKATIVVSII